MKKIFFLCLSLLIASSIQANEIGHFYVDLSSQNVSVSDISNSFANYVDVADGSTFTLFRDTIDELGIRHQSYQQYFQNTKVQSRVVLVHSKNGVVRCINGAVMTNSSVPQAIPARISRRQAAAKAPMKVDDENVSTIIFCLDGTFYNVYKVPSPQTLETLYVDVVSGEIIYRESALRNTDVIGRGYTRYSGWQNMTVYEVEDKYYLMDSARNIVTMSAQSVSPDYEYYNSQAFANTLPADVLDVLMNNPQSDLAKEYYIQYIATPMMSDYIQNSCVSLYSGRSDFYLPVIKSITISSAASSWWYDIWDTKPDLYCQICDANGKVIYTTSTKDDCSLPVTFNIPITIAVDEGYIIKIYDEDATSDSYGDGVTLNSVTAGTKTWSGSNTSGSIVIAENPSEYTDIQWGMQKTLDFYGSTFNRNSFDGNGHVVINLAFPPHDNVVFKTMPNNAAAQSTFEPYYMYYGLGDGSIMNPLVSLDVMAHEFTHMVTGTNGNGGLDYQLESGALNESFSDIMAMGVMQYTYGSCPWTIGADLMISDPNMRSLSNPKNSRGANGDTLRGAQPDTYKGECWSYIPVAIDTNQVVVHKNSGVQNYWYYLLSEGGSGTNDNNNTYSVSGIGINKATKIAFRNLIYYLAPCATFEDSRNGSIQAVIDLYGNGSQEHQSVVNAWHAVGVGDKYIEELKPGKYVIVANREKTSDNNWYYMTADLGSASTKRFQAVDAGVQALSDVVATGLEAKYIWELEADSDNWLIKNGAQYVTWSSGNSANLAATGKSLTMDTSGDKVNVHFNDGTSERYLSLNSSSSNNYFAFYSGTNQVLDLYFIPYHEPDTITIRAKMPSNWGTTISAWVWKNGQNGQWATLEKNGEWYNYSTTASPLNIIFVNGTTWNGDNNQTVDISISESTCIQLDNNTSGKRNYTVIECEEEPLPETDNYVVLAQRSATDNWYYMTSDLGTASTKRYQAVDAGTSVLANVNTSDLDSKYYWQLEGSRLHTNAGYSTWVSGNSANLDVTGKELTISQQADGTYTFSFADGTDTRYLALNKTAGNNYFAYYSGTNQIYKLTLIKEGEHGIVTTIDNIPVTTTAKKIFCNGQLFITLPNGTRYTATGVKVE